MKISALNSNSDWQFGRGLALYLTGEKAIEQKVMTSLKSFTNDWFLDQTANIDWFGLLSSRNNQKLIEKEIARVVLAIYGVLAIKNMQIVNDYIARKLSINIEITTIYSHKLTIAGDITP